MAAEEEEEVETRPGGSRGNEGGQCDCIVSVPVPIPVLIPIPIPMPMPIPMSVGEATVGDIDPPKLSSS